MIIEALSAFSGSFAGSILWHYAHKTYFSRKSLPIPIQREGSVEYHGEAKICSYCRSLVHKYEIWPNEHVVCANCIRERQHGQSSPSGK